MGAYSKTGNSPITGILTPGDVPPAPGLYLLDVVPDGEVRWGFPNISDIQDKDRYDVVLANPPFGGSERKEVQENFPIRTGETAFLFLQHFIRILKAGGRGAIVIKNTFLSNTDNASTSLRKLLLESCNLRTILDCPGGTFQGAGVKTVVHVGPGPNLIPATFERLTSNVRGQLSGFSLGSFGRRAFAHLAHRPWLTALLPSSTALLRAPSVEHIMLEDWLLDGPVPTGNGHKHAEGASDKLRS